ncbi:MAG: tetratricopeptide repeat protein [Bacillota bacterium]
MLSFKTRKRFIKGVFWVLTIALGIGLVSSSVIWTMPDEAAKEAAPQRDTMDSQIARAEARKDVGTLLLLANYCAENNDIKRAEEVYKKVLKIAPENEAARLSLAEMYYMNNRYDDALAQLEAILEKSPDHQKALYYRGLSRGFGKKDYAGAVSDLERFVSLAKSGPDVDAAKEQIKEWSAKQ